MFMAFLIDSAILVGNVIGAIIVLKKRIMMKIRIRGVFVQRIYGGMSCRDKRFSKTSRNKPHPTNFSILAVMLSKIKHKGVNYVRFDKERKVHTLEEDILNIWKEHGLSVTEEVVQSQDSETGLTVWIIKAVQSKNFTPRVPS